MIRTLIWTMLALSLTGSQPASGAPDGPVVVVFDIETEGLLLNKGLLGRLDQYLSACLSEAGYRVLLRSQWKDQTSPKTCLDPDCRARLTGELNAQLMASTRILRFAGACKIVTTLLAPGKSSAFRQAAAGEGCREKDLVAAIGQIGAKLQIHRKPGLKVKLEPPADSPEGPAANFTPVIWGSEIGKLSLNSMPWGRVWINGKDSGKNTPLFKHELPAGRHLVSVRSPKGSVASSTVEIWPDEVTTLIIRFSVKEPDQKEHTGLLFMNTTPWSKVIIDETIRDMTPLFRKLPPGRHQIRIEFAHGEVLHETVDIKPNEATKVFRKAKTAETFEYQPGMGLLKLHSFPWGRVLIDGKDLGSAAPVFIHQLSAGKHKMKIWFLSGASMSEEIVIQEGKTLRKIIRSE